MDKNRLVFAAALLFTMLMGAGTGFIVAGSPGAVQDVASPRAVPSPGAPVLVSVEPGEGPREIGEKLEEAGVIRSATQFEVLVALMGYDRILQAGEYDLRVNMPTLDVIYRMRRGIMTTRSVTVVEGWRIEQIADAVAQEGIPREEFIAAASRTDYDFEFLDELDEDDTLEGYLYPATYPVRAGDTAEELVLRMLETFDQTVPQGVREASVNVGLTFHQVVTLASIIEREAVIPQERPIMAQVFLTRLALGIPLEADPTVQYALTLEDPSSVEEFGYWKPELTAADLEVFSPYNTYQRAGLPPGPIASPRLDSIIAVVQPADTEYLYFVARPDGSHAFAETFEEHLENVEMYRQ